jgi:hypothetical protein
MAAADDFLAEAARSGHAAADVFLEAASSAYLVWVARERGNPAAGEAPLNRSQALLAQLTDPWERSEVLLPLSGAVFEDSALFEEVLALKRETGDAIAISDSLNNLGWDAVNHGDLDRGAANLEEALAIARELGDTFRTSMAVGNLGLVSVYQEQHVEALEQLRESLILCIRMGDRRAGSYAVFGLAAAAEGLGDDDLSVKLDTIRRAMNTETGLVYEALVLEWFEPSVSVARQRVGRERVAALEAEVGTPSLERALELLDASQSASAAPPSE